jgi:hypothetical protein
MQESTCPLHDAIRAEPDKYIGLLAYCGDELYEIIDYDDHPDMQELQGWPMEVVNGTLRQKPDECMYYVFPEDVLFFITRDVRDEFVKRYTYDSMEQVIAWLSGEDELDTHFKDLDIFEACHPQHTRCLQDDGTVIYYPANQLDTVFHFTKDDTRGWFVSRTNNCGS